MLKKLVKIANKFDSNGSTTDADLLDFELKISVATLYSGDLSSLKDYAIWLKQFVHDLPEILSMLDKAPPAQAQIKADEIDRDIEKAFNFSAKILESITTKDNLRHLDAELKNLMETIEMIDVKRVRFQNEDSEKSNYLKSDYVAALSFLKKPLNTVLFWVEQYADDVLEDTEEYDVSNPSPITEESEGAHWSPELTESVSGELDEIPVNWEIEDDDDTPPVPEKTKEFEK